MAPHVKIVSPARGEIVSGPDVLVRVKTSGIEFAPGGYSLHVMLDNEPFAVQYDISKAHRLHDVTPGTHTVRVYAATPMHEIVPGTLDLVTFSVAYENDENRVESGEPLLTYVLPQGEYLGIDCADITLNFAVTGVALSRRGYRVQYFVDGRRYLATREGSYHLKGLTPGPHRIRMELVDEKGRVAPGPFNSVERVIVLSPEKTPLPYRRGEPAKLQSIAGAMTNGRLWVAVPEKQADHQFYKSPSPIRVTKSEPSSQFRILHDRTGYERQEQEPITVAPEVTPEAKESPQTPPSHMGKKAALNEFREENSTETVQPEHQRPPIDYPPESEVTPTPSRTPAAVRNTPPPEIQVTSDSAKIQNSAELAKGTAFKASRRSSTTATLRAASVSTTGTKVARVTPQTTAKPHDVEEDTVVLPEAEIETPAPVSPKPSRPTLEPNKKTTPSGANTPHSISAPVSGSGIGASGPSPQNNKSVLSNVVTVAAPPGALSEADAEENGESTATIARIVRVPGPVKVERLK